MKLLLCAAGLAGMIFAGGDKDKYEYYGPDRAYSMTIPKNNHEQSKKNDSGDVDDEFVFYDGTDTSSTAFKMGVFKQTCGLDEETTEFDSELVQSLRPDCDCKILKVSHEKFKNIRGLQIAISVTEDGVTWKGYSFNTIFHGSCYSINFACPDSTFKKNNEVFVDIMNTMKIYK